MFRSLILFVSLFTTTITPDQGSDFATVRAGDDIESFSLSTSAGGQLDIEIVEESAVEGIGLFNQSDGTGPFFAGETMIVEAGSSFFVHIVAYTADDKYVVGAGADPFTAEVPSGDERFLSISLSRSRNKITPALTCPPALV